MESIGSKKERGGQAEVPGPRDKEKRLPGRGTMCVTFRGQESSTGPGWTGVKSGQPEEDGEQAQAVVGRARLACPGDLISRSSGTL